MARKKKQPARRTPVPRKRGSLQSSLTTKTKRRVRHGTRPTPGLPTPISPEKEFHLRTVLTSAPIILFALDKDGIFTLSEGKGLEKLGLQSDQLVGQSVFEVFHAVPDLLEKFRGALKGSLHHSVDRIGDALFEAQFSPLRNEQGIITGVIGVATDVTERKRLEDTLRLTEQRYQALIDSMGEGLLMVDNDDVIRFVNDPFCALLGYRKEELLGKVAMDIVLRPEDRELMRSRNTHRIKGIAEQYEIQLRKKSGELIWVQIGAAPMTDAEGNVVGSIGVHTDITGRKKSEEFLQESERRFRQLAENIQGVVWMADQRKPEMLYVSKAYETIWGRSCKSLHDNPRSFLDAIHPEDRHRAERGISRQLEGFSTEEIYRIVRPDGTIRWVRDRGFPILDRSGQVYRIAGIAEDITERTAIEEKRRSSEEWYRSLVENISEIYFVVDKDGIITYCSPNMELLTGYRVEEVLGASFVKLIVAHDRKRVVQFYRDRTMDGTLDATIEFRGRRKDGSHEWVEQSTRVIRDQAGNVVEYRNVVRNIRERKNVERQLRLLAHAVESTSEMICITDMEDRFTFANRAFLNAYGYELYELVGRKPDVVGSPKNPPQTTHSVYHETRKGGWKGELINRRKDGAEFHVFLSTSIIRNEDGAPVALMGVARDITEEKSVLEEIRGMATRLEQRVLERTAELALQRSELSRINEELQEVITQLKEAKGKAEEASRVKSQFLANVSHELRTPLNSVIGFANVLLKNKQQNLNRDEIDYLEKVLGNGKHLLNVINQMLDLSKIETGRTDLEITSIFLGTLIRETVSELQGQGSEGVEIRMEIPNQIAPLRTDYGRLKQVLINLIANALKFTRKGSVTIIVETNPLTAQPVRIDVRDTGIGIPEEKLGAIFEAFQQVDNSPSREYEGTGLGLTISRALCGAMGYRLDVTSRAGKGSVFSIHLEQEGGKETGEPT